MVLLYIVSSTPHLVIKAYIWCTVYPWHRRSYLTSFLLLLVRTNYDKFRGLNNTHVLSQESVGWKSEHGVAGFSAHQDEMKVLARATNTFKTYCLCPCSLVVGRIYFIMATGCRWLHLVDCKLVSGVGQSHSFQRPPDILHVCLSLQHVSSMPVGKFLSSVLNHITGRSEVTVLQAVGGGVVVPYGILLHVIIERTRPLISVSMAVPSPQLPPSP